MVDSTIELIGASVGPVEVEAGQEGALELVFVSGLTLPVQGPDGGPLRIPSSQQRYRLTKSQIKEYLDRVNEVIDTLPDGSGIVIPTSDAEVQQAVQVTEQVKGN